MCRLQIAQRTDERGRILNEIIVGMKIIKQYAWVKKLALSKFCAQFFNFENLPNLPSTCRRNRFQRLYKVFESKLWLIQKCMKNISYRRNSYFLSFRIYQIWSWCAKKATPSSWILFVNVFVYLEACDISHSYDVCSARTFTNGR